MLNLVQHLFMGALEILKLVQNDKFFKLSFLILFLNIFLAKLHIIIIR